MPGIFFGSKISGLCIFLGLQYEAPSDPPVMNTSSTPLAFFWQIVTQNKRVTQFYICMPVITVFKKNTGNARTVEKFKGFILSTV